MELLVKKQYNFHHVNHYNYCCYSVLQNTLFSIETYEYCSDRQRPLPTHTWCDRFGVIVRRNANTTQNRIYLSLLFWCFHILIKFSSIFV